eukprot:6853532-Prorocentrum_lima.AAC.1
MTAALAAEVQRLTEEYHSQRPLAEQIAALQHTRKAVSELRLRKLNEAHDLELEAQQLLSRRQEILQYADEQKA